jgi:hypothetical protein
MNNKLRSSGRNTGTTNKSALSQSKGTAGSSPQSLKSSKKSESSHKVTA